MISSPEKLPMGGKPRFFKFVNTQNILHLRLPPLFVEKYGENLPEIAKIRTSSGETWKVELEQVAEERRFGRGWSKFAADVGLSMGEFLEFCFDVDESTFDVLVLGINGCGRKIPVRRSYSSVDSDPDEDVRRVIKDLTCIDHNALEVHDNQLSVRSVVENEAESDHDAVEIDDDMISEEVHPKFKITLREHHRSRMVVNKDFIEAAGLMNEKAVVLQNPPRKRCWAVLLYHHPTQHRIQMGSGWNEFGKRNGLVFGKTYLFEYIPDKNVIEVKMIKKGN